MRSVILAVIAVLLTGCAKEFVWDKPGATIDEFRRDKYECVQQSRTSWSGGGSGVLGLTVMASAQYQAQQQSNSLFRMCLEARGYTSHDKQEAESVPSSVAPPKVPQPIAPPQAVASSPRAAPQQVAQPPPPGFPAPGQLPPQPPASSYPVVAVPTATLEPQRPGCAGDAVAVPAVTIQEQRPNGTRWSRDIPAFCLDAHPVTNREFLAFVQANPQWSKSQLAQALHDGHYLTQWAADDVVPPAALDESVRYVSFYAAEAFCHSRGKRVPRLQHYRTAANLPASEDLTFRYETAYQAPDFHFVPMEWTVGRWEEGPDLGMRIPYHYGMAHRGAPRDPNYTPALEKRYTGGALGFRCAERQAQ